MDKFAVIGLGQWGSRLAIDLAAAGAEVTAVDRKRQVIEDLRDRVTFAVAMDATDDRALLDHGIDKVDVAIVGIGDSFESTVLVTVALKHLGVKRIISRAVSPMAYKVLEKIGADEIVDPETESADRWAHRLLNPHYITQFDLDEGHAVVEIATPQPWVGKTLRELNLRSEQRVHVVAIKTGPNSNDAKRGKSHVHMPKPDQALTADGRLVLMGADADLAKLPRPAPAT